MGHTEYNCIDLTFPHWALVESRMGPLWHGTLASGADKRKNTKHRNVDPSWSVLIIKPSKFSFDCKLVFYYFVK